MMPDWPVGVMPRFAFDVPNVVRLVPRPRAMPMRPGWLGGICRATQSRARRQRRGRDGFGAIGDQRGFSRSRHRNWSIVDCRRNGLTDYRVSHWQIEGHSERCNYTNPPHGITRERNDTGILIIHHRNVCSEGQRLIRFIDLNETAPK